MRIKQVSIRFLLGFFILMLMLSGCSNQNRDKDPDGIFTITDGWQYCIGDSPVDSDGRLMWLNDSTHSAAWTSVEEFSDIPSAGARSLWIRVRLPDFIILNPALHFRSVRQITQIYLNGRQIYQFGDFTSNDKDHFMGWHEILVRLPDDFSGGTLCCRIWSNGPFIGLSGPVRLAPADTILTRLFFSELDELIIAPVFIFLGVVLFILLIFFRNNKLILGTALFVTSAGVFVGSNSSYLQTVMNAPRLFFLLDSFSLLTLPIGVIYLTEQIIIDKFKLFIRRLWQMHLAYLLFSIWPTLFLSYVYIDLLCQFFFICAPLTVTISFILILLSLRKGGRDIQLLFIGLIIFYLFAGMEIGLYYLKAGSANVSLIHFGSFTLVVCLVAIVVDRYIETSRQKEAAQKQALESEKYRELDRIKSRFFANISHEFRTPLTLILGTAGQIRDASKDKNIRRKSELQIKNGRRLLNLVNELLDLSKVDAGHMELKSECRDILPQIRELCHHFESHTVGKGLRIEMISHVDEAVLCYDPAKIEKVLINLISNAVKFTPPGGRIEVSVFRKETLEISISDTGPGISEEHLPHIFDRFYQASLDYPADQQGSGIGLALARELVHLHHGEITVESEIGKGSVFTVKLPLDSAYTNKAEAVAKEIIETGRDISADSSVSLLPMSSWTKRGGVPIVLIVEDNTDLRSYIREELAGDYSIIEAENGEAGFEQAAQNIPDLVISDVMMPKMDGYQMCEKLKTDERTSHIPVVLLTARSDSDSRMEGLNLGADDYLTKPFEPDEIRVRIKNLIEQRRKLRLRFSRQITAPIKEIAVMPADEKFLGKIVDIIEARLDNPDLSVDWLSGQMALSRSQLHRKIQALTNQTVVEFIRSIRLKHAVRLMDKRAATISEIAYQTGFSNPDYFRRCFRKQFGISPTEYLARK